MKKRLKIQYPKECIGCELCVLEAQRQLKKVGIDQALIRVFRKNIEGREYPEFSIELDPRINEHDIQKIKKVCPAGVFEITEETTDAFGD